MEFLQPEDWERGARGARRPPGRAAAVGRHGRDGRPQLRPRAARGDPRSHARARARGVGASATARCASAPASPTRARSPSSATALPGLAAASRTVGSPQIRNRGTIGGNLGSSSPAGDALPPLYASERRGRARAQRPRHAPRPDRRVHHRPEAQRARARRADRRLPRRARRRAAAVLQGRHAQRDGDRGLLVRARAAPGASAASAPASARPAPTPIVRRRGRGVRRRDARLGRRRARRRRASSPASASWSRRPPARSTTSAAAPPTAATRSACWRAARWPGPGASCEADLHRQRRAARGRRPVGGREPAARAARAARPARRQERLRAGRVRLLLGLPRRRARVLLPRARRARPRAARSSRSRGSRPRASSPRSRRRSWPRARSSAASARPG